MTNFDKKYYDDIWGTVHRHDYCQSLADRLTQQYGKVRMLDIGTGCGFLVKTLREKGCDAWGLEISDYALENSCAATYVIKGDVRGIPFEDNRFDLVISQGLWEYIPEGEVDGAFDECQRVGRNQWHNFDSEDQDNLPEHQKITIKPRKWWNDKGIGIDVKLKLNLGCGGSHYDDYTNIDLYCPRSDVRHDLRNPLPYADSSVDEIYASHIVEHFSREEWKRVKKDWYRVLKPNRKITIECPDLEVCIKKYVEEPENDYWLKTIYGQQIGEGEYHKNGFTYEKLINDLKEVELK